MLVHWIWLATRPNVSDRIKQELIMRMHDPEDIFYAEAEDYRILPELTDAVCQSLMDKSLDKAWNIIETCKRKAIHILTYQDAAYPSRLKNISDPPMVFYYKGRLPDFDAQPFIGVVGTRGATAYGLTAAQKMGYQIACCGGALVSGAAEGIDAAAMSGALSGNGTVVGILGCGADVVYPASNRALFADMSRYGCLLSEFVPGTPPYGWNFPKRNRIISGLSNGVLVVEAPRKSGSLITAELALEQGRDVFVIPGNIDSPNSAGSNALLREGAVAVSSGWDMVGEYEASFPGKIHPSEQPGLAAMSEESDPLVADTVTTPTPKKEKTVVDRKKTIDKDKIQPYSGEEKKLPQLNEQEQRIVNELTQGERLTDDVIAATGIAAGQMLGVLTMLEIKGVISRLPGNRIALK